MEKVWKEMWEISQIMWSRGRDVITTLVLFSLDGMNKESEEKLLNET